MERKVYISYALDDKEIADSIKKILDNLGIVSFLYTQEIKWGDDIIKLIDTSISDATDLMVIITSSSITSQWVKNEINCAIERKKKIIPFLVDTKVELPDYLKPYHSIKKMEEIGKIFKAQIGKNNEVDKSSSNNTPIKNHTTMLSSKLPQLLLVDDEKMIRENISELLESAGFQVFATCSRKEAEAYWEKNLDINIAIIDIQLSDDKEPDKDFKATGFRIIKTLKNLAVDQERNSVFTAFSAYDGHDNLVEGIKAGCDAFISKKWSPQRIVNSVRQLQQMIDSSRALFVLKRALERRTPYTAGHCERTALFCKKIIPYLNKVDANNFDLGVCLTAAHLHDIGKISIPDHILIGTQTSLTTEEKKIIQRHVEISDILNPMGDDFNKIAEIIRYHHLNYKLSDINDLSDYPKTTSKGEPSPRGEAIPVEARIIKVADVADAVLSDRLYNPGGTLDQAKLIMQKGREEGKFDPDVTNAFLEYISQPNIEKEIDEIMEMGKIKREYCLDLYYEIKSMTLGIFERIIEFLSDIYLEEGKAIDRVILDAGPVMIHSKKLLCLTLIGTKKDLDSLFNILKQRLYNQNKIMLHENISGFAEMDIMTFLARKSIPFEIALRTRDSNEIKDSFSREK